MFTLYPHSIPRCQHIKVNGTQCGSPALRRNRLCYFHKSWQKTRIVVGAKRAHGASTVFDLPLLEDANSIQLALMQVMRLILSGQLDGKTAGLLLYALQTASSNLARTNFEPTIKTRMVIDPRTVDQTPLGEDPWCREDFEEEEYEEEEYEEEDQDQVPEPAQAKAEDADKEFFAEETIANIEGRAAPRRGKDEQTIAQIQAVASNASRRQRRTAAHSYPVRAARDSRAVRGQIHAERSHCGGTTSTAPISLPPPVPLSSKPTCDERS